MKIDTSGYKLLIVDDVEANVILLAAIFRKEGFSVESARNGAEALQAIERFSPDLVLLDVMMPVMDGYEALQKIRENEKTAELPVLLLTALDNSEEIVKGFQLGANDYLVKPFKREELIVRIQYQLTLLEAKRTILKQQEELKAVIASRDKMYSVISHDLRSPIGSIKMMNNVLLSLSQEESVSDSMKEMIALVDKASEDAYRLLDNLLKWTKRQLGMSPELWQKIDLSQLLSSVISLYQPIGLQKKVEIELIQPDSLELELDAEMIKTVMRNLLSNAIKFSFEDRKIVVKCVSEANEMTISVTNFGPVIAPENRDKILNPAVHFTTYGTQDEKGSGLGLLLCRDFIQTHSGRFWFESDEQHGTTFYFTLPLKREKTGAAQDSPAIASAADVIV